MATKDISDAQVVLAVREAHAGGWREWPHIILMRMTGQPLKVCWRAMERADDRELIECGTSLRTAWPTAAGLALLEVQTYPQALPNGLGSSPRRITPESP